MRKFCMVLSMFALMACTALAEDMVRVPFLNGVYSVEVPEGWYVEQSQDGTSVRLAPEKNSDKMVLISAPNITVEEDYELYAGLQVGLLFAQMGNGEVTAEESGDLFDFPATFFAFSIVMNDNNYEGRAAVVNYDGAAVMFVSLAPEDSIDEFTEIAGEIIDSYEVDAEAAEKNAEVLARIAVILNEEIKEGLSK